MVIIGDEEASRAHASLEIAVDKRQKEIEDVVDAPLQPFLASVSSLLFAGLAHVASRQFSR